MSGRRRVDYVLPLRWDTDQEVADLTRYLRWLQRHARVIVVDGSSPRLFESHHDLWSGLVCHIAPEPDGFLNGKVTGVQTGMRIARAERVIIADDDVRYDETALRRTVDLLAGSDLVGPQNVFDPMPWHAAWDTARSLLNRAVAADYPGTFAVRRSIFMRMGGYSGDVLFENLELMRTVRACGGTVVRPRHLYVARRPPTLDRFAGQRVRQAFDDLAQPWRLAIFLPVLPVTASRRGRYVVAVALAVSMLLAEVGRRRAGGAAVFPVWTVLFAPAWVAERSTCSWLALGQRFLLGGVRYAGQRIPIAAHRPRTLRRRVLGTTPLVPARGTETDGAVRAVTEGPPAGPTTPAQRDNTATGIDLEARLVDHPENAAHQQRSVAVRRDQGSHPRVSRLTPVVSYHANSAAPAGAEKTVRRSE